MKDDDKAWTDELTCKGALVLEGVAGIGKTHSIAIARTAVTTKHDERMTRDVGALVDADFWKVILRLLDNRCLTDEDVSKAIRESSYDSGRSVLSSRLEPLRGVNVFKCVMHPATSYEDFIGGTRPTDDPEERFAWTRGSFLTFLDSAIAKPCTPHLFIMDEINRCNLPSVLGELLYLIEPSRRVPALPPSVYRSDARELLNKCMAIRVGRLGHSRLHANRRFANIYWIPDNLFILGTMNSSDRSILGFDQALRRRFPPYRLEPFSATELQKELERLGVHAGTDPWVSAIRAWASLNAFLRFAIGPDAMIGHSYWFAAVAQAKTSTAKNSISAAWRFGILPQVIQSAESARQEQMVAELFAESETEPDWFPAVGDEQPRQVRWEEACRTCGTCSIDPNELRTRVRSQGFTISLLGEGHGEKLVIEEKQTVAGPPKKEEPAAQPDGAETPAAESRADSVT